MGARVAVLAAVTVGVQGAGRTEGCKGWLQIWRWSDRDPH
jgi:hypothetical protein